MRKELSIVYCNRQDKSILSHVTQAIDSLVNVFHGCNVRITTLCYHCLSRHEFCMSPTEFSFEELVNCITQGNMSIKCKNDLVSLKDLAPDVLMSHLPVFKGVVRYEELGKGGFGIVYRFDFAVVLL